MLPFLRTDNLCDLTEIKGEKSVKICGLINSVKQIPIKKKNENEEQKYLKSGVIEDLTGKIEFVAFHKTLENYSSLLEQDKRVMLYGKYQKKDDERSQIVVEKVTPVENINIVFLNIQEELNFEEIMHLKEILTQFKGSDTVVFKLKTENREEPVQIASSEYAWVSANNELLQNIEKTFAGKITTEIKSAAI